MQFTVTINQAKALEWGLNSQQALLFAFVYECPSWARLVQTPAGDFYALSKAKILEELPLLTDKPDTAYRLLKQIAAAGVIDLSSTATITLVRLTAKGQEWNRKLDGSEKYPTQVGEKSEVGNSSEVGEKSDAGSSEKSPTKIGKKSGVGRKKIRSGSEKSPTNQVTSNQVTSNQGTNQDIAGEAAPAPGGEFVGAEQEPGPRCQIPADMPGPKDPICKAYRTWANYAMAYRTRYTAWPVWNASVAGKLSKLIDRVGQADAPKVAAFYVKCIHDARLIAQHHPLGLLLANAEGYHTMWLTNRPTTGTQARQQENTASNLSAAEQALAEQRARRAAHADA
ncbi:phage replication protein [Pseudomonas aeruginosa]|uniref:phage replication protein n=1 Tax=Pseudomonas aeruginosa TaxID=287 RepID=UPI0021F1189B|nr:phage replication protein [Pseudomonas aeruginosa]EKW8030490.1 phage replication protein [Pseudomonas aeruginosa]MCV4076398.1 phage replication protein [Pseudomonas aeruginosa]HCE9254132.1 phage replication protein [Pseudomonas aeruginosa]HCK4394138.1 phage replication protein [Pseudomonas aeruginosa]HCK4939957.1 phage replication protein [Pseudomonas aeruginosa]